MLKFKNWQLFILLSNYWILSMILESDTIFLNIVFIANMFLLFVWYYYIMKEAYFIANIKFKENIYLLVVIYLFAYMITEIIPIPYNIFHWVLWQYIAIFTYLYAIIHVSRTFTSAEKKLGIEINEIFSFLQFFIYPIGIFYISKRIKNMENLKI